jgi:hypothetical protein
MVVPVILLGAVLLAVDRVSFADLLQAGKQLKAMGSNPEPPVPPHARPAEKLS